MLKGKDVFVFIGLLIVTGYLTINASEQDNDGMRSVIDFNNSIKAFPYEASSDRVDAVTKNFPKLKLGQTKEEVKEILGEPDFASYIFFAGPPKKFATCKWVYNFYKGQALFNNPATDKVVQVLFDQDENVNQLIPMNVPGLTYQGSPITNESTK